MIFLCGVSALMVCFVGGTDRIGVGGIETSASRSRSGNRSRNTSASRSRNTSAITGNSDYIKSVLHFSQFCLSVVGVEF